MGPWVLINGIWYYGTAAALAGQLDLRDDQQMLHESLEEEKQADVRLTKLAKGEVNPDALAVRFARAFADTIDN